MLHGLETFNGSRNHACRHAGQPRGAHRRQRILHVVLAFERNLRERQDGFHRRLRRGAIDHVAALYPCALRHRMPGREPENRRVRTSRGLGGARVVCVQHREVACVLRGKDALLGQRVVLKGAVPVEMIGRDVQDHRDLRMELFRAFELEAGNLQHRPRAFAALIDEAHHRHADVAGDQRRQTRLLQDFAGQRRRRGFAVGAGDGQDLAFQKARGQFQLADHRAAEVAGLHQFGRIQRHTGTDYDQVLAAKSQQAVAARLHHDALIQQRRNFLGKRLGRANIGYRHLRALPAQKQRRRKPGLPQAHHQNFFAFQFHRHSVYPTAFAARLTR